jgi:hypothetical protein
MDLAAGLKAWAQPQPPDVFTRRFPWEGGNTLPPAPETQGSQAPLAPYQPPAGPSQAPPPPAQSPGVARACNSLGPEQRLSCPLQPDMVLQIEAIQDGVQLTLKRDRVDGRQLRQVLLCQEALSATDPAPPPPCPFLADGVRFDVGQRQGRVTVALTTNSADVGVGVLRERVEVGLGAPVRPERPAR